MTLTTGELLTRLAGTLRHEIGPAVADEYTRTQAFMAAVILERVGRQVDLAPAHDAAEADDLANLYEELRGSLDAAPADVATAVDAAEAAGGVAGLTGLIEAIYRWGTGEPAAAGMLDQIRTVLRRDIDRRLEIAR